MRKTVEARYHGYFRRNGSGEKWFGIRVENAETDSLIVEFELNPKELMMLLSSSASSDTISVKVDTEE